MNLKAYFNIWNDSWKMFRKYAGKAPLSEKDWCDIIREGNNFRATHGGEDYLATKMVVLVMDMLAHEQKKDERKISA